MNLKQKFQWPVRVYYEDTDAGGVVYHARYVAFFERARTELLRAIGFSQNQLLSVDIAFAVRSMSIEFYRPAVLDDELIIETKIEKINNASILFNQKMIKKEDMSLLSEANVLVASVSKQHMKAIRIPNSIKVRLNCE